MRNLKLMSAVAATAMLVGTFGTVSTAMADRGDRYSGGRQSIDDRARSTFRYDDRRTSSRDYDRSRADYTVDRSRYVTRYHDSSPRYSSSRYDYSQSYRRYDSGTRYYSSRPSYSVNFGYGSDNCYDYGRDRVSVDIGYRSGGYRNRGEWSVGFGYSSGGYYRNSSWGHANYYYRPAPRVYYYNPPVYYSAPPVYYAPPVYAPNCGGYWGGGSYSYWR